MHHAHHRLDLTSSSFVRISHINVERRIMRTTGWT
jgi:hypothetical protein